VTVAWTTPAKVVAALGTQGAAPPADDPYLVDVVAAANAASYRKRRAAGYVDPADDGAPAPSPDIGMGATYWAVALWRERSSTDGFGSFEDLAAFMPTGGSWATIRRLLGIGRARVDYPADPEAAAYLVRRRRRTLRGARRL
jgi:hypothetical protein